MMRKATQLNLIVLTPIFILLSHYLAVFPHEYMHSFMAWFLGFKNNPMLLNYGGTSWNNILLLAHISENVNYLEILNAGHRYAVALIAFSGAWIANGILFAISLYLLNQKNVHKRPYLFYFLFWFNLMNLGNFYDYVPIRTFANTGDIFALEMSMNISPWWIYIVLGYLVAFLIWDFFTKTLITAYKSLGIKSNLFRAGLMISCVLILFGFFSGIIGIFLTSAINYNNLFHFASMTSVIMIPGIIVACWPTRLWVKRLLKE